MSGRTLKSEADNDDAVEVDIEMTTFRAGHVILGPSLVFTLRTIWPSAKSFLVLLLTRFFHAFFSFECEFF